MTNADLAVVISFGAKSLQDVRLPNYLRERKTTPEWEDRPLVGDLLYPDLTSGLFRVLHRVHQELGPGFLHQVYRRAVMVELTSQQINYEYIKEIPVYYRDHHRAYSRLVLSSLMERYCLPPWLSGISRRRCRHSSRPG